MHSSCFLLLLALVAGSCQVSYGISVTGSIRALEAVANRDLEGSVVVSGDNNFQPSASACARQCAATPGCNVYVFCGNVAGCVSGGTSQWEKDLGKYRACWLKQGSGPGFPYSKNPRDQQVGWISGVVQANYTESEQTDQTYSKCYCKGDYSAGDYHFRGVCATMGDQYSVNCELYPDSSCRYSPSQSYEGCPDNQPCKVLLDTDLEGTPVGPQREVYMNSAEECCWQCARTQRCNTWTWCSDPSGCNGGELVRFRQCWLKNADPLQPVAKRYPATSTSNSTAPGAANATATDGGTAGNTTTMAPGWVSGVRLAFIK